MNTASKETNPTTPTRATLGKHERLSRKKLIDQTHEKGVAIKVPSFVLVHHCCTLPSGTLAQLMTAVGKKNFKRAHDRNRIKRLIREAYRKQKHIVYTALENAGTQAALIIIFTGRTLPTHNYVFGKISELLSRFAADLNAETALKD